MSHVDEGILHALLDGALAAAEPAEAERVELHLAACPDCRARLDDAARLRDEAGALLASAQPRVSATPPFEVIRARAAQSAGAQQAAPSGRRRGTILATPFSGFAWAATVVLAVGLGWLLNDTVDRTETVALSDAVTSAPGAGDDSPEASEESAASDLTAAPLEPAAAAGVEARSAPPPTPGPTRAADASGVEESVSQGFQSLSPPAPPPARQAAARQADYDVLPEAGAVSGVGVTSEPAAAPPSAPAPATSAAALPGDGWRAASLEQATRMAGELIRLEGADVVGVATRSTASGVEVRTVQMTDRGEMLTLVQRPRSGLSSRTENAESERRMQAQRSEAARSDEAAAAEAPALESAFPAVSVQIDDWVVTISGAVARERLEQLAAELD